MMIEMREWRVGKGEEAHNLEREKETDMSVEEWGGRLLQTCRQGGQALEQKRFAIANAKVNAARAFQFPLSLSLSNAQTFS